MAPSLGMMALVALVHYFAPASCRFGLPRHVVDDVSSRGPLDLLSDFGLPQPSINGTPSFLRYQDPPPDLRKRDCLANGTNYCFGDTANYCTSCGTCCSDATAGKWCCPSDGICCGAACCASGQTCNSGQCFLPT